MMERGDGYLLWMAGTEAYQNAMESRPTEKAQRHAPKGGINIDGIPYLGGEFIPSHGTTVGKGPGSGGGQSRYDFVPAPGGGNAWWHIDDATAQAAGLEKGGEIRVQYGFQHPTEERKGFGIIHLDFRHKKDYIAAGFTGAREFLAHVLQSGSEVWSHTEQGKSYWSSDEGQRQGLHPFNSAESAVDSSPW